MIWFEVVILSFFILLTALLTYLASGKQLLFKIPLPKKALLLGALSCAVIALFLLLDNYGRVSAIFIFITSLMMLWTIPPVCIAYWKFNKNKKS